MNLPRTLIASGVLLIAIGVVLLLLQRMNVPLGRLPGDIVWQRRNTTVYFPWVTCLALSAIGSLLLWLFSKR
jgi:hypothetical protein